MFLLEKEKAGVSSYHPSTVYHPPAPLATVQAADPIDLKV